MKLLISNGNIVLPNKIVKGDIEIEDGIITKISKEIKNDSFDITIAVNDKYILPGFVDLHTNGIAGFDLTNGLYDSETESFTSKEDQYLLGLNTALKEYTKHGVTSVGFTTLETSIKKMKRIFRLIARYKRESESKYKNVLHGVYMEGTFMKDKRFRGAHNPKYFFEPNVTLFKEFQSAADGNIKLVNVVPEWGDSALKMIRYLKSKNIVCAAGHTGATGKEFQAAIKNGLSLAIHVLNGPSSSSYKPFENGGALESLLKSDDIFIEFIPDGYHVDKSYIRDIINRKRYDKCVAISDSMFATKLKNIKEFEINGVRGNISKNKMYIQIAGREDENALFGSVLTMDQAFSNLLTWLTKPMEGVWTREHESMCFEDALIQTSQMCSTNAAKVLKMYGQNNNSFGGIEIGKVGDLVIADIQKLTDKYKLNVQQVILKGDVL